jgi:MFS family permease
MTALKPVLALLVAVALLLMGNGLQGTLLPLRAQLEAFGALQLGALGSAYFAGFALGCVACPRFVSAVGHIRAFTGLSAVAAAVVLAHALLITPLAWLPLRAVTGFCLAGLYVVMESWLNAAATNESRGTVLSLYTTLNLTVITGGQLIVAVADPQSFVPFALAAMLISLAGVPLAFTASSPPPAPAAVRLRPGRLYRRSPVALVGCFAVGVANGPFWTLGPAYGVANGLDLDGVALFMALTVLGGAIGQWPLGRLSDRVDRRWTILAGCLGAALAAAVMTAVGLYAPHGLLYAAFAFGLFAIPLYALCVAHANDFTEPPEFVETAGGLLLASALGSALGPALAGVMMAQVGTAGLYATTACVHVLFAGFVAWRMGRRRALLPDERPAFVAVPRTSPGLTGLDPRARADAE